MEMLEEYNTKISKQKYYHFIFPQLWLCLVVVSYSVSCMSDYDNDMSWSESWMMMVSASPTRSLNNPHDFVFSINIQETTVSFYWALPMTPIIRLAVVSLHLRHCHRIGGGKLSPSRSSGRPIQGSIGYLFCTDLIKVTVMSDFTPPSAIYLATI